MIDDVEVKRIKELSPRDIEHDNPEFRRVDETIALPRADLPPRGHARGHLHDRPLLADHRAGRSRSSATAAPRTATRPPACGTTASAPPGCWSASASAVWDAIYDSERWPEWWRGVKVAERLDARRRAAASASVGRYVWRSAIPYPVEFEIVSTLVERPHLLEGDATGELEGVGLLALLRGGRDDRRRLRLERRARRRRG